jgi:NAD(P)H-hydrate epimerase
VKIFSALQIKEWDQYSISNEPVKSIDLMERAATACYHWILDHTSKKSRFIIFCGNGNNGGDGLAIARLMEEARLQTAVYILKNDKRSDDCSINLNRLNTLQVAVHEITDEKDFPMVSPGCIIIDALFGTGLNKPLQDLAAKLVAHINQANARVISIDLPSGLFADTSSSGNICVKATDTLSFQTNKLAFMMPENEMYIGNVTVLDIGLHQDFYKNTNSKFSTIDNTLVQSIYKPRKQSGHKYSFGHALLFAGSKNMMGASILSAKACLRSGAGLVTVHMADENMHIIQTALPEAIASSENDFATISKKKAAIGIGPGLAIDEINGQLLEKIITEWQGPLVIDASALQMLYPYIDLLKQRTNNPAILTPHTGEFEKLFGKAVNDFHRTDLAIEKAIMHQCYIILKGHHSLVACLDGSGWFNTTGNSGMATAGSGDVLTGIITGLLAQGYPQKEACLLGVYLHGLAGDLVASQYSQEAMIAGDITEQLGAAYKEIKNAPSKRRSD